MMRLFPLLLGASALVCAWLLPLPRLLPGPFAAHMTMHMLVVAVAAPLLALAVAGSPADPVRHRPALFPAIPLSVVELVVVWAFHAPALHHFARHTSAGFVLEQGAFLASGLLVWIAALGGGAAARIDRAGPGVVALLLTSMHMTFLGALLALAPRPLYEHAPAAVHGHGAASIDPLSDQQLGGAIMLLVGGVAYLAGGVWLTAVLLRHRRSRAPGGAGAGSARGPA